VEYRFERGTSFQTLLNRGETSPDHQTRESISSQKYSQLQSTSENVPKYNFAGVTTTNSFVPKYNNPFSTDVFSKNANPNPSISVSSSRIKYSQPLKLSLVPQSTNLHPIDETIESGAHTPANAKSHSVNVSPFHSRQNSKVNINDINWGSVTKAIADDTRRALETYDTNKPPLSRQSSTMNSPLNYSKPTSPKNITIEKTPSRNFSQDTGITSESEKKVQSSINLDALRKPANITEASVIGNKLSKTALETVDIANKIDNMINNYLQKSGKMPSPSKEIKVEFLNPTSYDILHTQKLKDITENSNQKTLPDNNNRGKIDEIVLDSNRNKESPLRSELKSIPIMKFDHNFFISALKETTEPTDSKLSTLRLDLQQISTNRSDFRSTTPPDLPIANRNPDIIIKNPLTKLNSYSKYSIPEPLIANQGININPAQMSTPRIPRYSASAQNSPKRSQSPFIKPLWQNPIFDSQTSLANIQTSAGSATDRYYINNFTPNQQFEEYKASTQPVKPQFTRSYSNPKIKDIADEYYRKLGAPEVTTSSTPQFSDSHKPRIFAYEDYSYGYSNFTKDKNAKSGKEKIFCA